MIDERTPRHTSRRNVLALAVGSVALAWCGPAYAGSYLNRAALLLVEGEREARYLRGRLGDRELARVIHRIAASRVKAASTMTVPKEIAPAHPHLLLAMEAYERAANAAMSGQAGKFIEFEQSARDEDAIFRGLVKQMGWTLPEV